MAEGDKSTAETTQPATDENRRRTRSQTRNGGLATPPAPVVETRGTKRVSQGRQPGTAGKRGRKAAEPKKDLEENNDHKPASHDDHNNKVEHLPEDQKSTELQKEDNKDEHIVEDHKPTDSQKEDNKAENITEDHKPTESQKEDNKPAETQKEDDKPNEPQKEDKKSTQSQKEEIKPTDSPKEDNKPTEKLIEAKPVVDGDVKDKDSVKEANQQQKNDKTVEGTDGSDSRLVHA